MDFVCTPEEQAVVKYWVCEYAKRSKSFNTCFSNDTCRMVTEFLNLKAKWTLCSIPETQGSYICWLWCSLWKSLVYAYIHLRMYVVMHVAMHVRLCIHIDGYRCAYAMRSDAPCMPGYMRLEQLHMDALQLAFSYFEHAVMHETNH